MTEFVTIQEAKDYLRANWEKGCHCPCCGQGVKLYPRQPYSTLVKSLIRLAHLNNGNDDFHHMSQIGTPESGGGDFSKLRYCKLVLLPSKKFSGISLILLVCK